MGELLLALAALVVAHAVPSAPRVRPRLVSALGRRGFGAAYGLLSLALLAWVIAAYRGAEPAWLWVPYEALRWIAIVAMPVAFWLMLAGLMQSPGETPCGIHRVVVSPASAGVVVWAGLHLLNVAHARGLAVFGAFAVIGGVALIKNWRIAPPAHRAVGPVPFAALILGRQPVRRREFSLWPVVGAVGLWLVLLWLHPLVIGVDPTAGRLPF